MNNSPNIISEFNNTLDEFINKMILQFPQETKLKTYYSAFKVTKMYDNTIPIKIFMGGCLEFKEPIKERNSLFFTKRKLFMNKVAQASSSFADDTGLVNYWETLSDVSKNAIWDYIQTLFVMGEMYVNKDTSIIQNISNVYNKCSFNDSIKTMNNNQFTEDFVKKLNE